MWFWSMIIIKNNNENNNENNKYRYLTIIFTDRYIKLDIS